jgi:hypothetical protein
MNAQLAPIQKNSADMDARIQKGVEQALGQWMKPFQTMNNATMNFFGREDVESGFDIAERDKMLLRNPKINETYQVLAGNEMTADSANEYVYNLWKAGKQSGAVNEAEKYAAGALPETPGSPMNVDGSVGDQDLLAAGLSAAESYEPEAKTRFTKKFLEGTRLKDQIDILKNYAQAMDPTIKD